MKRHLVVLLGCICALCASANAATLQEAVGTGEIAEIDRLLEAGGNLEAVDESGLTLLIIAALAGREKVVAHLIAKGADPAGRDAKGFTTLHAAAHRGHLKIVKLLVEHGVAVNDRENPEKLSPLHAASERGHRDVAAFLLAEGAEMNVKTAEGKTPMTMAVLKAHGPVIKLLRDHGADCSKIRIASFRDTCMTAGN